MDLSLGFLFCSIDLYFCLCARTILSWWLCLCSIYWNISFKQQECHASVGKRRYKGGQISKGTLHSVSWFSYWKELDKEETVGACSNCNSTQRRVININTLALEEKILILTLFLKTKYDHGPMTMSLESAWLRSKHFHF